MTSSSHTKDLSSGCNFSAADLPVKDKILAMKDISSWVCSRSVWDKADKPRCVWHAEKDDKSQIELMQAEGDSALGAYLVGANLTETDLKGAEFTMANLSGADLVDANLSSADLSHAELSGANLETADLIETNLASADLTDASLFQADLTKANLTQADFTEANVRAAVLTGAEASLVGPDFSGADLRETDLSGANFHLANFSGADIERANLSDANLRRADLRDAILVLADLTGADLTEAKLRDANLYLTDLREANLSNTNLTQTDLSDDPFLNTDLVGVNLSGAYLVGLDFTGADLSRATLTETDLRRTDLQDVTLNSATADEAVFTAADCERTKFVEASLTRATFENANLSGADLSQAHLYQTRFDGAQIDDQTQLYPGGDIGDQSTANACRYDSDIPPHSPMAILTDQEIDDNSDLEEARARRARSTYSRLETLARENGFPELKSEMFIRRQDARRELLVAQNKRLKSSFARVQKLLFNYGESFFRVAAISLAIIIGSWLWFLFTGTTETVEGRSITFETVMNDSLLLWKTFYHSISVFFAGQGPLEPTGIIGEVSNAALRASGPVLLALLIFVLGRRAAR